MVRTQWKDVRSIVEFLRLSCFYGDVAEEKQESGQEKDAAKKGELLLEYNRHKSGLAKNLNEQPYQTLQLVQIYFDTATFDEISRDVKNTMETQISVIGGTTGLFTGHLLIDKIELGVCVSKTPLHQMGSLAAKTPLHRLLHPQWG